MNWKVLTTDVSLCLAVEVSWRNSVQGTRLSEHQKMLINILELKCDLANSPTLVYLPLGVFPSECSQAYIHQEGDKQLCSSGKSRSDLVLGRNLRSSCLSHQWLNAREWAFHPLVFARCGSLSVQIQQHIGQVCVQNQDSSCPCNSCPGDSQGSVFSNLCLP